jgi:hypothetical protein
MKKRATGFYCVVLRKPPRLRELPVPYTWVIGFWNGSFWKLPGSTVEFQDSYFENISDDAVEVSPAIAAQVQGI